MKNNIIKIISELEKKEKILLPFIGFSIYGSMVYWTNTIHSDIDILIIVEDAINIEKREYLIQDYNIFIETVSEFQENLNNQKIKEVECYFSPYKNWLNSFEYKANVTKLRHSISKQSALSWVKAKKKIILENEDTFIWLKSLFHSLRILNFWIQLCKYWKIKNFKVWKLNNISYQKIIDLEWKLYTNQTNWNEIGKEYKVIYKKLEKEFKILAPK